MISIVFHFNDDGRKHHRYDDNIIIDTLPVTIGNKGKKEDVL